VPPRATTHPLLVLAAALSLAPVGCGGAAGDTLKASVIDSVIPREEAIQRFQAGLERAEQLSGGADSREELVRSFIDALEARDTVVLVRLTMTRAEFAYLYYSTNPQSLPPYDLSPDLFWFLLESNGRKGLSHALEERGGTPLRYVDHRCAGEPSREGENTVWGPCLVRRVQAPGDTITERLFGPIIERGGRYKFVSLTNKL